MRYALTQTVAPTVEPLSTAEAKSHLRVEISDDDTLIDTLVKAAREYCEAYLGQSLITQTWKAVYDAFPSGDDETLYVPRPPLSSVTSIVYVDTAGASQTLAASLYRVDAVSKPGRITPAYGEVWPSTRDLVNAVELTFVSGYGAAGSNVPQAIRQAMLLLVGHWYENREAVAAGQLMDLPRAVDALLSSQWHGSYE